MRNITTKQFQLLSDSQMVWDLLVENYAENGVMAPFFEYAITSSWLDKRYLYLNRIWLDKDKAVGFVFHEQPCTNVYFSLRHGYETLAEEMIDYAEKYMPGNEKEKTFHFCPEQKALMDAAGKKGYRQEFIIEDYVIDFDEAELNYPLPEGFHFVKPDKVDPVKHAICCWKGFDHEDKGPFENWEAEDPGTPWNPQKAYQGTISNIMAPPPHSTYEHNIIIANEKEEYVCFSGMWWVSENKLAYMEPLCTIPEYRHKGLAAAALSAHYRKMKELGAVCMTGGGNEFYRRIGYNRKNLTYGWKKQE
ncbi:MAG: GNAT family N-acetyltransferase [Lachnospiraceae bacterium]|nr:GNAT family N-acetyltransferase [Lachnospiraceae bacterium]